MLINRDQSAAQGKADELSLGVQIKFMHEI